MQVNINLLFISRTKDKRQRNEGYNSVHFSPYTMQSGRKHRTRPCEAAPTRDIFPAIRRKKLTTKHKKPRCQDGNGAKNRENGGESCLPVAKRREAGGETLISGVRRPL